MGDIWKPITPEDTADIVGEGVHTGLRKGTSAPESSSLWNAIHDSGAAWSEACAFFAWGLDYMGMAICKRETTDGLPTGLVVPTEEMKGHVARVSLEQSNDDRTFVAEVRTDLGAPTWAGSWHGFTVDEGRPVKVMEWIW